MQTVRVVAESKTAGGGIVAFVEQIDALHGDARTERLQLEQHGFIELEMDGHRGVSVYAEFAVRLGKADGLSVHIKHDKPVLRNLSQAVRKKTAVEGTMHGDCTVGKAGTGIGAVTVHFNSGRPSRGDTGAA